jgi:hypothetical protein
MKKAGRRFIFLLAGILLLSVLVFFDFIRRAEGAIDFQEERISHEFASFRETARPRREEALVWADYALGVTEWMQVPSYSRRSMRWEIRELRALIEEGRFFRYEDGSEHVYQAAWTQTPQSSPERWSFPFLEPALVSLAIPQELMFAGGLDRAEARQGFERRAIEKWRILFSERGLSASEAKRCAEITDRLRLQRPAILEAIRAQSAIERHRVIQVLRLHSDDRGTFAEKPSWRSIFLWRIFIAQTLTKLDRLYADLEAIENLPIQERSKKAGELSDSILRTHRVPPVSTQFAKIIELYEAEESILRDWAMLRLALALARYGGERGHFPADLEELVPTYLPNLPEEIAYEQTREGGARIAQPRKTQVWRINRWK